MDLRDKLDVKFAEKKRNPKMKVKIQKIYPDLSERPFFAPPSDEKAREWYLKGVADGFRICRHQLDQVSKVETIIDIEKEKKSA